MTKDVMKSGPEPPPSDPPHPKRPILQFDHDSVVESTNNSDTENRALAAALLNISGGGTAVFPVSGGVDGPQK